MKKLAFLLCLCTMVTALAGCASKKDDKTPEVVTDPSESMIALENELAGEEPVALEPLSKEEIMLDVEDVVRAQSSSIVYTVTNMSDYQLTNGDNISLYYNDNGEWVDVALSDDAIWSEYGITVSSNSSGSGEIDIKDVIEELPEGTYMLEKDMYNGNNRLTLTSEFKLTAAK